MDKPPGGGMELLVGRILQIGVLLSVACLVTGVVWRWHATGSAAFDYSLQGRSIVGFLSDGLREGRLGHLRPRFFVNFGLALLLMTPYVRVLASFFYFAFVEHNAKYAVFTSIVLGVLTYSLFGHLTLR
jgi:uncharacterized membrane protein